MATLDQDTQDWLSQGTPPGQTATQQPVVTDGVVSFLPDDPQPGGVIDGVEQGLGNGLYGAAMGFATPVYGWSQLAMHDLGSLGAVSPQAVSDYDNTINGIENEYQSQTPGSWAAGLGRTIGTMVPFVASAFTGAPEAAAAAEAPNLLMRIAGGAGQGAALGALAPVGQSGDFTGNKMAQMGIGAVMGGGLGALGASGGLLKSASVAARPQGAAASTLMGVMQGAANPEVAQAAQAGDPAALSNILMRLAGSPLVPGSQPTLEQLTGGATPVMTAKAVRQFGDARAAYADQMALNNAARLDAVHQIAGTQDDMAQAIAARRAVTQPGYDSLASAQPVDATPVLQHIKQLQDSSFSTDPTIAGALKNIEDQITNRAAPAPVNQDASGGTLSPSPVLVRPDLLDGIRQNLRNIVQANANGGPVQSKQVAALQPLVDTIVDSIDAGHPGYRGLLAAYANASTPINTMAAGQDVLAALHNSSLDAMGNVAAPRSRWLTAIDKAVTAEPPIDPSAAARLRAIAQDVQRSTISNQPAAGGGSDTNANLLANDWLFNSILRGQSSQPNLAGAAASAVGLHAPGAVASGLNLLSRYAAARGAAPLSQAFLDPAYAAEVLARYGRGGAVPSTTPNLLMQSAKGLIGPYARGYAGAHQ